MKYVCHAFMVITLFSLSCRLPKNSENQIDSAEKARFQKDSLIGGNMIKSEAPDAMTQINQGYALPRYDDGLAQSPINILSDSALKDRNQTFAIKFNTGIILIENLGYTIQLDFKQGSTTIAGGKTYSSLQFHFHTPSEHMIDGMTFPMEMHIVNVLEDSNEQIKPQYLVIGLLFKMGRENKFIKEFLNVIPPEQGKDTLAPGTVNFEDLLNAIPKNEVAGFYYYKGSLTTYPFSETVDWIVKKYILEASPEQIGVIEKTEGENARHVHALYARKVFSHDN
ncbi:MAG TPA: carbonic anhydrase family protein [Puia sp.]|nr:carbonic anhydrase family protein [Puia sp.]